MRHVVIALLGALIVLACGRQPVGTTERIPPKSAVFITSQAGSADFFVATATELQTLNVLQGPADTLPSVPGARVEAVKLTQLRCLLDGSRFESHLPELDRMYLRAGSSDGPWVIAVPAVVEDFLATADEAQVASMAARWAATEEWRADGGTTENLRPWMWRIAQLARHGRSEGRQLYLWFRL